MKVTFAEAGNKKFVTSIGRMAIGPSTYADTVIAELRNESLAKYAWLTNQEANKGGQITSWSTGDTAFGPAHTNDKFNINGSPVFMKKATAWASAVPKKNDGVFKGGTEWGITIPYPANMNGFIGAATDPVNGRAVNGANAILTFDASGSIRLRVPSTGYDSTFASVTCLTKNGAFAVIGGNLSVEGTVVGDLAIGAVSAPIVGGGNVLITGDIRYKTNPETNPASTDKLGVYAEHDLTVTYDGSNPAAYQNRIVDASIFSLKGEFNVQDAKSFAPRGILRTLGAMAQYYRGEIGKVVGGGLQHGYNKNFRYDERLAKNPPKYYPSSGRYTLYAWREN
ncbi:MAG TPA: hypothetical protein DGH68_01980 [Bacteroidetes bacterium]|nr:hypothetical protein [Bacteroidota bacterium]